MRVGMMHVARVKVPPLSTEDWAARDAERELVVQAQNGSGDAFERLVERYGTRIFRLAQNITRHRQDAEDVVQNAFVQAFKNLPNFRGDASFYTWLRRITVNEALTRLRRRRPNEVSIDEPVEVDDAFIPREIEDWGPNPEQSYSQQELRMILDTTISELEPGYRMVFQLRDIEGLSTEQVAEMLDLTSSAVKTRLQRARMKLRNSLDKYFRPVGSNASVPALRGKL
jgi:RNA polymerase sigma-70 factor, ECF subfamily